MENANEVEQASNYEKLDAIIGAVKTECAPALANRFYAVSFPNEFENADENLFDTPHGYWGTAVPLPDHHSDRFHQKISNAISKGSAIDIVTMGLPNGNLHQAICYGVHRALDIHPGVVYVRILCGSAYSWTLNTDEYVKLFYKNILNWNRSIPRLARLKLFVASQDYQNGQGWNHGKVLVVDQKEIIFGGHNMWGDAYMGGNPVFDLSIALKGDLAVDGTVFANELWRFVRENGSHNGSTKTYCSSFRISENGKPQITKDKPDLFKTTHGLPVDKGMKALYLGQPGAGLIEHDGSRNPIFVGMNCAFRIAKKHINLIQQDIGSARIFGGREHGKTYIIRGGFRCIQFQDYGGTNNYYGFYFDVLDALARALKSMLRPTLQIVVTNAEGSDYTNGLTWRTIYRALGFMLHKVHRLSKTETNNILANNVLIKNIAFQRSRQWRDNNKYIGLHTKYWEVDGEVVSVGSFNLYPSIMYFGNNLGISYLTEFGVVLAGEKIVNNLKSQYFDKVWENAVMWQFTPGLLDNLPDYSGPEMHEEEVEKVAGEAV